MSETQDGQKSVFTEILDFIHEHCKADFPSKPHRRRTVQQYLEDVVQECSDVDEAIFEAQLSDEAKAWVNYGIDAMSARPAQEVPVPEGFEEAQEQEAEAAAPRKQAARKAAAAPARKGQEAAAKDQPAEAKEGRKAGRKAAANGGNAQGPKTSRKQTSTGALRAAKPGFTTRSVRRLVLSNPKITVDELLAESAKANGKLNRSTVAMVRQSTRVMCHLMAEAGWTPPKGVKMEMAEAGGC